VLYVGDKEAIRNTDTIETLPWKPWLSSRYMEVIKSTVNAVLSFVPYLGNALSIAEIISTVIGSDDPRTYLARTDKNNYDDIIMAWAWDSTLVDLIKTLPGLNFIFTAENVEVTQVRFIVPITFTSSNFDIPLAGGISTQPIAIIDPDILRQEFLVGSSDLYTNPGITAKRIVSETRERTNQNLLEYKDALYQNYPNPFNTETTIIFQLKEPTNVKLSVYNSLGQLVTILADGYKEEGFHSIAWDGNDRYGSLGSGIHYIELKSDRFSIVKNILLIK